MKNPNEFPNQLDNQTEQLFINPDHATLQKMLEIKAKLIYIPRKIDITRLKLLALRGRDLSQSARETVRVLDLGGGHGFIDKLLADELRFARLFLTK